MPLRRIFDDDRTERSGASFNRSPVDGRSPQRRRHYDPCPRGKRRRQGVEVRPERSWVDVVQCDSHPCADCGRRDVVARKRGQRNCALLTGHACRNADRELECLRAAAEQDRFLGAVQRSD